MEEEWKRERRGQLVVSRSRSAPLNSHDGEVDGDEHQDRLSRQHDKGTSECARDEGLKRKVGALEVGVEVLVRLGVLLA